jgi:chitinase
MSPGQAPTRQTLLQPQDGDNSEMKLKTLCLLSFLILETSFARAQGTVPTFRYSAGNGSSYTLFGRDPAQGSVTNVPTVLVPLILSFEGTVSGGRFQLDATRDVPGVLSSPVFSRFSFGSGEATQYADAMLRATFPKAEGSHTVLAKPEVNPITVVIPPGNGYVLTSKRTGASFAVVDVQFLQREIFKQLPRQDRKLVVAIAHNTTFYADGDATICCSWGTHGVDTATGNSFVLASYLHGAPAIVEDRDVQPLTQQLAEFIYDPLHDPLFQGPYASAPGNRLAGWMRPGMDSCAGTGVASRYFLLEPTDTNPKNNIPASKAFVARSGTAGYHVQNIALLSWYLGNAEGLGNSYSFPDTEALTHAAKPCPVRQANVEEGVSSRSEPTVAPIASNVSRNGHQLIGYWIGYGPAGSALPLRQVSPQWDTIIVAFASPAKNAPEGTLEFHTPAGLDTAQFKSDIAYLKSRHKKVMISLGGGGQYFSLADSRNIPNFVSSVTGIVAEYGFDGIDIDFESPSLILDPGDTDFKHPTTPSVVNLISGLRQLHDHFGPGFMISLVPEGPQIPAGHVTYGGQFGSYLPIAYAIRDILSFIDVQDYNTPPLEGLDGEIYQSHSVDYHAAMAELLLHGFNVAGNPQQFFPPEPADKVAVGFLVGYTTPPVVADAMRYIITGHAPAGTGYRLRKPGGYPDMIGAMFWTIDADRRENYSFSNVIGPQLHGYPARK